MMSESRIAVRLLCLSSFMFAACSTEHEFRVASVGDGSGAASAQEAAVSTDVPLIVAAGSALLGPAARISLGTPLGPASGTVNGTIAGVLPTSGQSVVQLTDGTTLLVNGVGGTLGQAVSIDVASARVIGGPTSLVGVSVLPSGGAGGQLASTSIGNGGPTVTVGTAGTPVPLPRNPGGALGSVPGTVTTTVNGTLGPICC